MKHRGPTERVSGCLGARAGSNDRSARRPRVTRAAQSGAPSLCCSSPGERAPYTLAAGGAFNEGRDAADGGGIVPRTRNSR